MGDVITLTIDEHYFLVGFRDSEFKVPLITTVIYQGLDPEGEFGHLFAVVGSDGNTEGNSILSFKENRITNVLDQIRLAEWLQEDHNASLVGKAYAYDYA